MEYKDYYATLGVDKAASQDAIKQSYRRLARKYHPDVSKEQNAEEKFKNLQEAYEVLKDPEKRKAYDELGSNWKAGQEFRQPPGWEGQTQFYGAGEQSRFTEEDLSGFSDFFTNLFGRGRQSRYQRFQEDSPGFQHYQEDLRGFQQRGTDQHAKITITLEEAFHGTTKTLTLQYPELDPAGNLRQNMRTIKVNIPAATLPGQNLRLAGQGNPGTGDAPAGDLYLEIEIAPHHLFTLQGKDIYLTVPVTPSEIALGTQIKIPTLGGVVGLKLPPGSQGGQKQRLKGRGMPVKTEPGDQYAILQVLVPPAVTEADKQLYEKMAQQMPFNPRKDWPV